MERKHKPGEILYVDSNYAEIYNCLGVVVEDNFWLEEVKKEGKFPEEIYQKSFQDQRIQLVRVLGTRVFRRYWDCNDPDFAEPNEEDVFNYRFQHEIYVAPADLRSIINLQSVDNGRLTRLLISGEVYVKRALHDAKLIYDYLDGKRAKHNQDGHVSSEEKFLRMLEKAIPLD